MLLIFTHSFIKKEILTNFVSTIFIKTIQMQRHHNIYHMIGV